jgi:hypothetical protein
MRNVSKHTSILQFNVCDEETQTRNVLLHGELARFMCDTVQRIACREDSYDIGDPIINKINETVFE